MSSTLTPAQDSRNLKQQLYDLAAHIDTYRKSFDARKDSRAIFAYTYVLITTQLAGALETPFFTDREWIVRLAEAFAAKYIAAITSDAPGLGSGPAWAEVFDTMRNKRTSVLEDLLFPMMAHIIHDLPIALVETGLKDGNNASHIRDFHQVNDVLAKGMQAITDAVTARYEPFFRWLDHLEEKHAQVLTNYGFRISRGMAWYNAERLLDPSSRAKAEVATNNSVLVTIKEVRRPPLWSARILLKALRWFASLFRRWPDPQQ